MKELNKNAKYMQKLWPNTRKRNIELVAMK